MTFAAWYSATIAPQLDKTLKNMPPETHAPIRQASRESMAACWNAALGAANKLIDEDLTDPFFKPDLTRLRA